MCTHVTERLALHRTEHLHPFFRRDLDLGAGEVRQPVPVHPAHETGTCQTGAVLAQGQRLHPRNGQPGLLQPCAQRRRARYGKGRDDCGFALGARDASPQRFENLTKLQPHVHLREIVDQLDRRAVGQVGHFVVGQHPADHALGPLPVGELVARLGRVGIVEALSARRADYDAVGKSVRTPGHECRQQVAPGPSAEASTIQAGTRSPSSSSPSSSISSGCSCRRRSIRRWFRARLVAIR